jgi:chromosome transmission fidelity protein 1
LFADTDEPAWVREHAKQEKKERILRARTELEERLKAVREKEAKEKANAEARDMRFFKKAVCMRVRVRDCETLIDW